MSSSHIHVQHRQNKKEKNNMEIEEDVVIVGGGIAGLATAVALKRMGVRALVLEKAECLRATGAALSLFPSAWVALDALGVSHKLTSIYPQTLRGSITTVTTGAIQEVAFSTVKGGIAQGPRIIHRKALLEALAEELPTGAVRCSSKIVSIESQRKGNSSIVIAHLQDGTTIKSKVLIGCDGVHSAVARWLGLAPPVHSVRWAVRGLAVFPQGHGFSQEIQQFVDMGKRAGFVPLNDTEIYWFLTCGSPPQGENYTSSDPELIQRKIIEDYAKTFPQKYLDVVRHADLSTVTSASLMFRYPWHIIFGKLSKGNVTVAGDAMHPMTPDLGQGGCSALEDAVVLGRHIGNSFIGNGRLVPGEMDHSLDEYVKERRWRAAGLVTVSYFSGWVQQDGSKWWTKFLRDSIFYKYIFAKLVKFVEYDCGKLPAVSCTEPDHFRKED